MSTMIFDREEVRDLAIAGILLSTAFAILLTGGIAGLMKPSVTFIFAFGISFLTAGTGFLLHELAHKMLAQHYGLFARFRAFRGMLMLSVVLSFFGFIFAAPGAVFIKGVASRQQNGRIALAGPVANILLAGLFFLWQTANPSSIIAVYGLNINALLALFNLLPVMPLDGAKVFAWNKVIFGSAIAVSALLFWFA